MPAPTTTDLLTIAADLRACAAALVVASEREARAAELLRRCGALCREDGVTLGPVAEALVAEIDAILGGN